MVHVRVGDTVHRFIPLLMWQDKPHIVRAGHLLQFVYGGGGPVDCAPPPLGKFTEDTLGQHQLRSIVSSGMAQHAEYGTYILDQGTAVVFHLSGRKLRASDDSEDLGDVCSGRGPVTFSQDTARSMASAPDGRAAAGFVRGAETWVATAHAVGLERASCPLEPSKTHKFKGRCFLCGAKGHSKTFCPVATAPK